MLLAMQPAAYTLHDRAGTLGSIYVYQYIRIELYVYIRIYVYTRIYIMYIGHQFIYVAYKHSYIFR